MTRRLGSYAAFCSEYDDCYTMREYLEFTGVVLPRVNVKGSYREGFLYQYSRPLAEGEWHSTKKAAKASYKAILRANRDRANRERSEWMAVASSINDADYMNLRKAVGGYSAARPGDWLGLNCFTTGLEGDDFESAMRLASLGLMEDCGPWKEGKFFQVSANGCRALGIPEGRINNSRFL